VRFASGDEVSLRRTEFAVLKQFQLPGGEAWAGTTPSGAAAAAAEEELEVYRPYVIYRCVVGSRAYGLEQERSDVDRRGIYLPPAELHWSLYGVPEQVADTRSDEVYWELQKFLMLALKANPNILECLYTPLVEEATPLADELRALRAIFLSHLIYQSYGGYVFSQFRKLEADLRTSGAIRWKHAMHLVRLLLAGIIALREGYVPVEVREHREELLAIRQQRMAWVDVDAWRLALHREFDAAYAATQLPERPDYARANAFLVQARRSRI
jgi:predicted nucleotidyltransferase